MNYVKDKNKSLFSNFIGVVIAVLICQASGLVGSMFTIKAIPTWYAALEKPSFNPPNWIFGPVWTTLYTMMGISLFLVWRARSENSESHLSLKIFATQLILNAIWTPVFFGMKQLLVAFVIIALLWVAIIATIISFRKHSQVAAALLVPYLLWVSFATLLNFSLWLMNR